MLAPWLILLALTVASAVSAQPQDDQELSELRSFLDATINSADSFQDRYDAEVYTRLLWVFEGITSYYDELIPMRAGCYSPVHYAEMMAAQIQDEMRRPGRDVQNLADKVEEEVFEDLNSKQSVTYIQAVRGGGKGDVTETHMLWRHSPKAVDHIVSPLVLDGRMLLIKSGGIATCFDTTAGKSIYGPRRIGNSSRHLASPVYGDGKIYVQGENGTIVVLQNGPKLKVLEKNELNETAAATPAIADGRIFIRTRGHLYCFAKKSR